MLILALPVVYFIIIPDQDRQLISETAISIANDILNLITNILVIIAIFLYGFLTGIFAHILLHLIDDAVEYERKINNWLKLLIGVLCGLVFAGFYIWLFHQLLSMPETWVYSMATRTYFGWQPWTGEFDRSPVMWGVYTFITFLVGYFILFPRLTDFIDDLHVTRGVGNPG